MRRMLWAYFSVAYLAVLAGLPLSAQDWRPVGPPGGDVRSLAADANDPPLVYLGVSNGHIFGSRDGGEHWQLLGRVGQRLDSVVTAIVADPRHSATLYAGTWTLGPNGGGVFRTDDGGLNWRAVSLASQSLRALAQAPCNPNILVAGTLQGVFRSGDAGKNWELISPANHEDLRNFDSVAIDPSNPEIIYAGTYHLAWKTTDGGRQWMPIHAGMVSDSDVMSISIDGTDPQRIFASACSGIYRSDNAGALWTRFHGIPPTARRTHVIRQDPLNSQTLYSATTEGLWKTIDGGAAWSRVTPANWSIAALVMHPKSPGRLVIGVEGQGVYISEDAGKNFHAANEGFYHRQVIDLAVDRERPEELGNTSKARWRRVISPSWRHAARARSSWQLPRPKASTRWKFRGEPRWRRRRAANPRRTRTSRKSRCARTKNSCAARFQAHRNANHQLKRPSPWPELPPRGSSARAQWCALPPA